MALALYRRYRSKTLSEIVGQETTVKILKNAAAEGRLGHAYLFYGVRGTGKTSIARILAKLLNCEKRLTDKDFGKLGEPCNSCEACQGIDQGTSLEVIEIDAASNRGIDEIRNLKESIRSLPMPGRHKVYIIDEVHMLTGPAWNALLKTLEEPPAHAALVLATTEFEKIPATITSRCQRFLFKRLTKAEILSKLEKIVAAEKILIEPAALEAIAAAAEGAMRDAESLLDQITSVSEKVDLLTVEQITGRVGFARVTHFAELLAKGDPAACVSYSEELLNEGHNLITLVRDLIHYLRRALVLRADPKMEGLLAEDLTAEELTRLKKLSGELAPDRAVTILKSLIRAYSEMRYSPFAIVPLELALMESLGGGSSPSTLLRTSK